MGYKIEEVKSIPTKDNSHVEVYPELLDAAMDSATGVISATFDDLRETRNVAAGLHQWCKTRHLDDVFEIRQRKNVLFVKEIRTAERHGQ